MAGRVSDSDTFTEITGPPGEFGEMLAQALAGGAGRRNCRAGMDWQPRRYVARAFD